MTTFRGGAATDVGLVRSNNQDQMLMGEALFAVADGMGGHAGGEVAALAAVESLKVSFDDNPSADGLANAVRDANRIVWERAQQGRELRGMGTTLTAVALVQEDNSGNEDVLALVNVGDSRAYLLRDGELEQLTEDHSVPEELRRAGRLTDAEAAAHPQRNVLTRALGIEPEVEVDCFQVTPFRGDRLVLSSDGLYNEVDDAAIATVLRRVTDPEEAAQELVTMAKNHGGNDNITVVVVDVVDDGDRSVRAAAALASQPKPAPALTDRRPARPDPKGPPRAGAPTPPGSPPSGRPPAGSSVAASSDTGGRRVTGRAVLFVSLVLLVFGAAFGATVWYGRGGYFVGAQGEEIVIFKGRPGGLLWLDPTVADRTGFSLSEVRPARADDIRAGKEASSLTAAERYVRNVTGEATPPTTTTTTAPGPVPTVPGAPITTRPVSSAPAP